MNTPNASPQNVPQSGSYTMPESAGKFYYTGKFEPPPKPNLKVAIGEDAWTYFQYHCKTPPNRFQRWMMKKLLGIKVEILK
jgi:hypothetical protein